MRYIVDTHSLVWYLSGDKRLIKRLKMFLEKLKEGRLR